MVQCSHNKLGQECYLPGVDSLLVKLESCRDIVTYADWASTANCFVYSILISLLGYNPTWTHVPLSVRFQACLSDEVYPMYSFRPWISGLIVKGSTWPDYVVINAETCGSCTLNWQTATTVPWHTNGMRNNLKESFNCSNYPPLLGWKIWRWSLFSMTNFPVPMHCLRSSPTA